MASNYDEPPLSEEEMINEVSKELSSRLQISRKGEPQACCPALPQASSTPPEQLPILLQKYEAAMQETNLMKQDESTLALALHYKESKNYDKGLIYFKQLHEFRLEMFGPNSRSDEIAYAKCNIEFCLGALGQYATSMKWTPIAMTEPEVQEPMLCLANTYCNQAAALNKVGQYHDALELYKKSIEIRDNLTCDDDEDKAKTLYNIGLIYSCKDHNIHHSYNKSLEHFNDALTIFRSIHGTTTAHSDIANCLNRIALTHYKQKEPLKALIYFDEALEQYKEIYCDQPYHLSIEKTTSILGALYLNAREYSLAVGYLRELVRIRKAKYGRNSQHEQLVQAYRCLLKPLKRLSKISEARKIENIPGIGLSSTELVAPSAAASCVLS